MKALLTGNEAIARGAYEAGVRVAAAYPGTPSTEILENIAKYDSIYSEWSPNEKVALEVAIGASIAGVRALAAMKHVGVNVAADPLFTVAYTGVTGGLVLVSADDPGMHSSQNEQDNRLYAKHAKIPMLEPSDSQEAKDFVKIAFEISEKYDTVVLIRVTTRVCHSKSLVELGEPTKPPSIAYTKQISKYVATPANSRSLRVGLEDRLNRLADLANTIHINSVESFDRSIGIVASGVAYQYAREALGDRASYLKLGMTYPVPIDLVRRFRETVERLYVVEELEPFLEEQLKAAGIDCTGKEIIPGIGELSLDKVRAALERPAEPGSSLQHQKSGSRTGDGGDEPELVAVDRPPMMCAGCPHRGAFYVLNKRRDLIVTGDIGCYTLGSAEPLSAMDTCICMGASISAAHGASKAFEASGTERRIVAVIGDSTFFHSGITGLIDLVYNHGNAVVIVLDNRITGMTGHQDHPGTGYTLKGSKTKAIDIGEVCRAVGVESVFQVNPLRLSEFEHALDSALEAPGPSVIISKWPCVLKKMSPEDRESFPAPRGPSHVNAEACRSCRLCLRIGCPALSFSSHAVIDPSMCAGCGVCVQVCPFSAIAKVGAE